MPNVSLSLKLEDYSFTQKEEKAALMKSKGCCIFCNTPVKEHAHFVKVNKGIYSACSMCKDVLSLDKLPKGKEGKIIFLPEIPQNELNNLIRAIWYVESISEDYEEEYDILNIVISILHNREDAASHYYASGINETSVLVKFLYTLSPDEYRLRSKGLYGLRWLPAKELYVDELPYWYENMKKFSPDTWGVLLNTYKKKILSLKKKKK